MSGMIECDTLMQDFVLMGVGLLLGVIISVIAQVAILRWDATR